MKFVKFAAAAATGLMLSTGLAAADEKPVVGLIMKSLANEFFQNMLEGAEAHAAKRGDYELRAVGMQNETDFESQINAVENFITQGSMRLLWRLRTAKHGASAQTRDGSGHCCGELRCGAG